MSNCLAWMFCILSLCIFYATSKASENLNLLWNSLILSSVFVVIICCRLPWRPKTVKQITLDIFQNCDVPEEVSGTLDPEVDLNDDAFGTSRYERFYSVRSPIKCNWKSKSSKTFGRAQSSGVPLNELSRVKLRRLTRENISKNILKSSKIHDYTRRATSWCKWRIP